MGRPTNTPTKAHQPLLPPLLPLSPPQDFATALTVIKPSVNRDMLAVYDAFTRDFGTTAA